MTEPARFIFPQTNERPTAIIIAPQLVSDDSQDKSDSLDELESLLSTLGIPTAGRVIQRRQRFVARSLLGEGKIAEIKQIAKLSGSQLLVFDHELSPGQVRNLEEMTGLKIYDRTAVILEIFSEHARTNQAKTQVEIARLEYMLPRLTGAWTHFQRQKGGGVNSRGMGETQIEVDRRRARERISRLQKQLGHIRKERRTQSKARRHELKVALVGYTNSGKTTLMNALTKSEFKAKDELFATLDASIRVIDPRTRPKILLSDTVGFIKNLPHRLVESFKSTLDHVIDADLLLHVVDASAPNYRDQVKTTEEVLAEIGAGHIPSLVVFNKIDKIPDPFYGRIVRQAFKNSIVVSAERPEDILKLREHVYSYFENNMQRAKLRVPHALKEVTSLIFNHCLILKTEYSDQAHVDFWVQATQSTIAKLSPYVVNEVEAEITVDNVGEGFEPYQTQSEISPG